MPHTTPGDAPRILLVRFSSIGDILLTTPLVRALRARQPEARIDFLTKARFAPLLAENPHLSGVLTPAEGESLPALAARLRAANYTHRLDLHGSLRTSLLRLLLPGRWSGYRKRRIPRALLIRTKRNFYGAGTPPVPERYFEAARGLDTRPDGGPPEFFLAAEAKAAAKALLRTAGLDQHRGIVALAPGAAHATKRWPLGHWKALGAALHAAGRPIVVVGGPEDAALAGEVATAAPGAVVAAGRLDLQGTGALVARCAALVSGDTGVMHIATAVGTPVLAFFGPTVGEFGFFPYQAKSRVLERPLACRPCSRMGGEHCPLGHHDCLRGLLPGEAIAALAELERP